MNEPQGGFRKPPIRVDAELHLHIHHHGDGDGEQAKKLDKILANILKLEKLTMATAAEFQAGFDRVDAATTGIANLIRTLIDRPLSGMSTAEEDTFKAKLEQVASSLEAMAATPTDPVPEPVPDPIP